MEPTWTCHHPSASESSCDLSSFIAVRESESCDSSSIVVRTWIWNTTDLKKAIVLENKQEAMWTRSKKQEATPARQQLPRNVSNCRTVGECTVANLQYFTVPHIVRSDSNNSPVESTQSGKSLVRWLHWVNLEDWIYASSKGTQTHTHTHTIQNQQSTKFYSEVRAS